MKDFLGQIYNGFLLRDLLGYIVPGAFVLACLAHLYSLITELTLDQIVSSIPDKGLAYFFLVCLCYICGHFLSGIFFHTKLFKRIFAYSPKDLFSDYPSKSLREAKSFHRSLYRNACDIIPEAMQNHIERHGALLHFLGHISASFLFTVIYIIAVSVYLSELEVLIYSIPLIIVFPGIYSHYNTIMIERYLLEKAAIETAEIHKKLKKNDDKTSIGDGKS